MTPPDRATVAALAGAALDGDDAATATLFGDVIEPLCDAFTAAGAASAARILAQVIDIARRHPACGALADGLDAEGIASEADLLARERWGLAPSSHPVRVARVLVLSRVTLGADVAIVGRLLADLARRFPDAERVLVGPDLARPLAEALGARMVPFSYARRGGLAGRLNGWDALRRIIAAEREGATLLVDPDTRLTQTGLMVPGPAALYRRFPSREMRGPGTLGDLAAEWSADTFGGPVAAPARLPLRPDDARFAAELRSALSGDGRPLVAAGFGTGGNDVKRVGPAFEAGVLRTLRASGARVLLARGVGAAEVAVTRGISAALASDGASVVHLPEGRHRPDHVADVVTWSADTGAFFAAIAAADLHVGYDSAGQHIASALGVPGLTAFVAAAGPRHADRWAPSGPGQAVVVRLDPGTTEDAALAACRCALVRLCAPQAMARARG